MHQEYLDSICLYQCYGHPHGVATMTCNPNWLQIQERVEKLPWADQIWWQMYSSSRNSN